MADAVGNKKNSIDRISSLPDDLLLHIFSFLSDYDKIQTSVLSRQFFKLRRLIPFLYSRYNQHGNTVEFEEFMELASRNRENLTTVRRFFLKCCCYTERIMRISRSIKSVVTACSSNLQELNISVHHQTKEIKLPSSVFSCRKLKFLRLAGDIKVQNIPTHVLFPCLKTLELVSIHIVVKYISVVMGFPSNICPVLEVSHIEDCFLGSSYKRSQIHLKYFRGYWVQGDSPNHMSKRDPTFKVLKRLVLRDEDMIEIVEFMSNVSNQPVFKNLTHLEVKVDQEKHFRALSLLLEHSPNLTSLVLDKAKIIQVFPERYKYNKGINQWGEPADTFYECLAYNLETVQIKRYYGFQEVFVVRYFLENALVLKKLILFVERSSSDEIKASILDEPRASAQCVIEFRSSES